MRTRVEKNGYVYLYDAYHWELVLAHIPAVDDFFEKTNAPISMVKMAFRDFSREEFWYPVYKKHGRLYFLRNGFCEPISTDWIIRVKASDYYLWRQMSENPKEMEQLKSMILCGWPIAWNYLKNEDESWNCSVTKVFIQTAAQKRYRKSVFILRNNVTIMAVVEELYQQLLSKGLFPHKPIFKRQG